MIRMLYKNEEEILWTLTDTTAMVTVLENFTLFFSPFCFALENSEFVDACLIAVVGGSLWYRYILVTGALVFASSGNSFWNTFPYWEAPNLSSRGRGITSTTLWLGHFTELLCFCAGNSACHLRHVLFFNIGWVSVFQMVRSLSRYWCRFGLMLLVEIGSLFVTGTGIIVGWGGSGTRGRGGALFGKFLL